MERLGGTGIWAGQLRYGDPGEIGAAAAELDSLGYTALWVPDVGGDLWGDLEVLMSSTNKAVIATGILNLWLRPPAEAASEHARLTAAHGDRFLMGIGVSHQILIDSTEAGRYQKPLSAMAEFLDGLDAAPVPVSRGHRVLAALGPKMLELARDRAGGCHPYNVTVDHTAMSRAAVGPEGLVLPEQAVALTTDATRARALGRKHLEMYLALPNYANNLLRLGFTPDDLSGGGSDKLVDALVAWGDADAIAARVQEHRDAGADHVCIQALTDEGFPWEAWRELAPALNPA